MLVTRKVKFSTEIPNSDIVLKMLMLTTGLDELTFTCNGSRQNILSHAEFPKPTVSLIFDAEKKEVIVWSKGHTINYLSEAAVATLVKLGGKYSSDLNPMALQKWVEIKGKYVDKIVPGFDPTV